MSLSCLLLLLNCFLLLVSSKVQCSFNANVVKSVLSTLEEQGYTIETGTLAIHQNVSHFGANPSTIYLDYAFDPRSTSIGVETLPNMNLVRLFGNSALIWFGCTPPMSQYFSLRSYLFRRINLNLEDTHIIFGSLGASLNDLAIKTSNIYGNAPFDEEFIAVTTGDQQTYTDIQSAISQTEASMIINIDSIPSEYALFSQFKPNTTQLMWDEFNTLTRISLVYNSSDLEEYFKNNLNTLIYHVFLSNITGQSSAMARIPFAAFRRNTSTGVFEQDTIKDNFEKYVSFVVEFLTNSSVNNKNVLMNLTSIDTLVSGFNGILSDYGFSCIEHNIDCLGDSRDAMYFTINGSVPPPPPPFTLQSNEYYVLIGINHFLFDKAQYSNIALYATQPGITGSAPAGPTLTNFEYVNSSLTFPPNVLEDSAIPASILSKLFVVAIARSEVCDTIMSKNLWNLPSLCINAQQIPETSNWTLVEREYLCLQSKTRLDLNEAIFSQIFKFTIQNL